MSINKIPKATHDGNLKIGDFDLKAYNLDNGERVLSRIEFLKAIGRTGKAKGGRKYDEEFKTPVFLTAKNLKDFISEDLLENSSHIHFTDLNGNEAIGYKAQLLPEVCYVFIDANEKGKLLKSQMHILERSKKLVRGFATVGIIALIDEATGYQDVRVKDALQEILDQYLLDGAKKYQVTFPLELYKQWFRLNDWEWKEQNAQKRPGVIGKWTNKYIYERIAPNILKELEKKNPKNEKGYREFKHFQFLTDEVGEPKLREFFGGLIALARATTNWRKYTELVERAYPKIGDQLDLFIDDE